MTEKFAFTSDAFLQARFRNAEMLLLVDEDVVVEAENTETKRSNGFDRIVKSPSRQNVSKTRQKLPISALPLFNSLFSQEKAMYCRILEN